jgi:hypothetical protein
MSEDANMSVVVDGVTLVLQDDGSWYKIVRYVKYIKRKMDIYANEPTDDESEPDEADV